MISENIRIIMNETLKSLIVPFLVIWVVLDNIFLAADIDTVPNSIKVFIKCLMLLIPIVSGSLIVMYYGSLPPQKKTILVHLMQLFLAINTIILLHTIVVVVIYNLFNETLKEYFLYAPNLACSIFVQESNLAAIFNCLDVIVCFKTMAALMPNEYLSMNHNQARNITFIIMTISWVFEYSYYLICYETLCTDQNIYNNKTFFGLIVDETTAKTKPKTLYYHMAVGFTIQAIKLFCEWWKTKKTSMNYFNLKKVGVLGETGYPKTNQDLQSILKQLDQTKGKNDQCSNLQCQVEIEKKSPILPYHQANFDINSTLQDNQDSVEVHCVNPEKVNCEAKNTNDFIITKGQIVEDYLMVDKMKEDPLKVVDISFDEILIMEIDNIEEEESINVGSVVPSGITSKEQQEDVKCEVNGVKGEVNDVACEDISGARKVQSIGRETSSEEERAFVDVKINNFVPRIGIEEVRILEGYQGKFSPQQTLKPQLLKTDYAFWAGWFSFILILFTVFVNGKNDHVIKMTSITSHLFFIVMPTYWILRSEEKTKFVQRRFIRWMNRYGL